MSYLGAVAYQRPSIKPAWFTAVSKIITPTAPVLRVPTVVAKPVPMLQPTVQPVVKPPLLSIAPITAPVAAMTFGPSGVTSGGGGDMPIEDATVTPSGTGTYLPLILVGLGALFLLSRKGR